MKHFKKLVLASLITSVAACGGNSKSNNEEAGNHLLDKNVVILPVENQKDMYVHISNLKYPDKEYKNAKVENGNFEIDIPDNEKDDLFLINYGKPYETNNGETDFESGNIETIYGSLLLKGNDIKNLKFSINFITDYISQSVLGLHDKLSLDEILKLQDSLAKDLISKDLNGDGNIDFRDALVFDQNNEVHAQALNFDLKTIMETPLENFDNFTIREIYTNHPEYRVEALTEIIGGVLSESLPLLDNFKANSINVSTSIGGKIKFDNLNVLELNDSNQRLDYVFSQQEKNTKITLTPEAEKGYSFDKWVGCDEINTQNQCVINNKDNGSYQVSAQFKSNDEMILKVNKENYFKLSDLNANDYLVSVYKNDNKVKILFKLGTASEQKIKSLKEEDIVATLDKDANLFKVSKIIEKTSQSIELTYQDLELSDVYDSVNLDVDNYEPKTEDIEFSHFNQEDSEVNQNVESKKVWIDGYGVAVNVADNIYLVNDPDYTNVLKFIEYTEPQLQTTSNALNAKKEFCFISPQENGCPTTLLQNKRRLKSLQDLPSIDESSSSLKDKHEFSLDIPTKSLADMKKDKYQALVGGKVVGYFLFTNNTNYDFYNKGASFKLAGQTAGRVEALLDMDVWLALASAEKNKGIISYKEKGKSKATDVQVNGLAYTADDIKAVYKKTNFSDLTRTNISTLQQIINDPNKTVVDVKVDSKEKKLDFAHVNTMFYIPTPVGVAIPFNVGTDVNLYIKGYLGLNAHFKTLAGFDYSMNASADWMKTLPSAKANAKISPYFDASLKAGVEAGVGVRPAVKVSVGTGIEKLLPRMVNFNTEFSTPFNALGVGEFTFFDTFKKQYLCGTGIGAYNLKMKTVGTASIDLADGELKKKVPSLVKFLFKEYKIVSIPSEFNLIQPKVLQINTCSS